MKTVVLALAAASALTLASAPAAFAAVPIDVKAALADAARPATDVARER